MEAIHGIHEGATVEVTTVETGNTGEEILSWLSEGVRLEVTRLKPSVRGQKVTAILKPVDGQGIPTYDTVVASTYETWPNGCSSGCHFDADGHNTQIPSKFFDLEPTER